MVDTTETTPVVAVAAREVVDVVDASVAIVVGAGRLPDIGTADPVVPAHPADATRTTVATSLMFITRGYGNDRRVYISGGARVPTYGQQRPRGAHHHFPTFHIPPATTNPGNDKPPAPRRSRRFPCLATSQWWAGEDLNLRRQCRRVYSPFPLATRAPTRERRRIAAARCPTTGARPSEGGTADTLARVRPCPPSTSSP